MSAVPNPSARLDFRLAPEHKSLIERAASIDGQTVSSFVIATLVRAAKETIERGSLITLSQRDSEAFLRMLDSDEEPNEALKAAAARYKQRRV